MPIAFLLLRIIIDIFLKLFLIIICTIVKLAFTNPTSTTNFLGCVVPCNVWLIKLLEAFDRFWWQRRHHTLVRVVARVRMVPFSQIHLRTRVGGVQASRHMASCRTTAATIRKIWCTVERRS
uniref:Putative secreted protein n=1 Tax=Anopheles darlingi TaxID=43151 RepID=A0A2M4D206_ANODA